MILEQNRVLQTIEATPKHWFATLAKAMPLASQVFLRLRLGGKWRDLFLVSVEPWTNKPRRLRVWNHWWCGNSAHVEVVVTNTILASSLPLLGGKPQLEAQLDLQRSSLG